MTGAHHATDTDAFRQRYSGLLYGILSWESLDRLWEGLDAGAGWYLYAVGETPPTVPADAGAVRRFVEEIDVLLRREHEEDYCGIVYVDDPERPGLIKIFDPNNLGVSCGSSGRTIPPGWIMSLCPPCAIEEAGPVMAARRRWWQRLFPQA